MYYSSVKIVECDNCFKVVNDTMSLHEILFTSTYYEECELYLQYFNNNIYTSYLRKYVKNIKDLKIAIM